MYSAIEMIRRLIRQQTTAPGALVTNIHGATAPVVAGIALAADITWLRAVVPGTTLLDATGFYDRYFLDAARPFALFAAPAGALDVVDGAPGVKLYRTTATVRQPTRFSLELTTGAASDQVGVYLNGVLDRVVVGAGTITRLLPPGTHLIELVTTASELHAVTPATVGLDGLEEVLPEVGWTMIQSGYQDFQSGASQITLTWLITPRVGGWKLYRRQMTSLTAITAVGSVAADGTFSLTLAGSWDTVIAIGSDLYAGARLMGTALSVAYDAVTLQTSVRLKLAPGLRDSSGIWSGQIAEIGKNVEVARIRRTTPSGTASYVDTAVTTGQTYFYTIQAYGLFDESRLGPLSEVNYLAAGDTTPPAAIQILNFGIPTIGYPQVLNKVATVKFRTPSDPDYAGVRVVYLTTLTGTVTAASGATLSVAVAGLTASQVAGWTLDITSGTAAGSSRTVVDNTATDLTLDFAYDPTNAPAAGDTIALTYVANVVTDYGLPDTDDEFTFTTIGYGVYEFRTFDLAGNEQTSAAALQWTYTVLDDQSLVLNLPPQISLQELNPAEQLAFFPSGDVRADTTQYAVVVLSAADLGQVDPTAGVDIHYTIRGQATTQMPATTTAPVGVVDDPVGTRSRNILLTRGTYDSTIYFWAEDATGLDSPQDTFTVDYDQTPEIVSVEYRDVGNDVIQFTVTVDDDTQSISYWMVPAIAADGDPTLAAPAIIDTSSIKTADFSITLEDGQQKVLNVAPWTGVGATGTAGELWIKQLSRTPRTSVVFESRDAAGNVSGTTVRTSLYVQPARAQVMSRTAASGGNTASTLVDSATPAWTVNQFQYSLLRKTFYFVEVTSGANAGVVRAILANDVGTITVQPDWPVADQGFTYNIWDAATIINTDGFTVGTQVPIGDTIVVGTQLFFDRRGSAPVTFTYYSVLTGAAPEAVHTAQVDQDSQASVQGFQVVEAPAGTLTASMTGFDDDAKYWRLYARKGAWPTMDGLAVTRDPTTQRLDLDDAYLRWEDTPAVTSFVFNAGLGTWYFLLVPYNSYNEDGDPATAIVTVAGPPPVPPTPPATPQLAGVALVADATDGFDLSWGLLNVPDPTGFTVDITAAMDNGAAVPLVSGVIASAGAYADTAAGTLAPWGTGTWHVWTYTLQLLSAGVAVGNPAMISAGSYFSSVRSAPGQVALTGITSVPVNPDTHLIDWTTINMPDPSLYEVDVTGSLDGAPAIAIATNHPVTSGVSHVVGTFAPNNASGTAHVWVYSVQLKLVATGAPVGGNLTIANADFFVGTTVDLTSAASSVYAGGTVVPMGFTFKVQCSQPHINLITWVTSGTNDTVYAVDIYDGTTLIAADINPSVGSYYDMRTAAGAAPEDDTMVMPKPPYLATWNYAVVLKLRSTGTTVTQLTTAPLTDTVYGCLFG